MTIHRRIALAMLALVLTAPAVAFAAEAPADSVKFTFDTDGATIGRLSLWKTTLENGNVLYGGSAVLNRTDKFRWTAEMAPGLRTLVRSTDWMDTGQGKMSSTLTLEPEGGKPVLELSFNGMEIKPETKPLPAEIFYLPTAMPVGLAPLSDWLADKDPETFSLVTKGASQGAGLDLTIKGAGHGELDVRGATVEVRSFDLAIDGEQLPQPQNITLHQYADGGFLGITGEGVRVLALGGAPEESAVAVSEELMADVDGGVLSGTVALPKEVEGPWPGVVLAAGPGHADRQAGNGSIRLYALLAEELAAQGVATYRYDPRTHDTLEAYASDAAAACRALADMEGVDPARLVLIGHGRAALILGEAAVAAAADSLGVKALGMLGGVTAPDAALAPAADASWHASFLAYDARAWLQQAALPVMAIHGALDAEVPSSQSTDLKTWLRENGLRGAAIVPDGLNHYLQPAETGDVDEYPTLPAELGRGLAKRLGGFVKSQTR